MERVLIICEEREKTIIARQLYANPINDCYFLFDEKDEYDYAIVLDSVPRVMELNVDRNKTMFFTGETPYVRRYNSSFLNQFVGVYGCDVHGLYKNEHQMMNIYPWFIGRNFESKSGIWKVTKSFTDIENYNNNQRTKKVCLLSSNKKITQGHKNRVKFIEKIIKMNSDVQIDIYGNGYIPFDDKFDVLKDYEYSIVIENSQYPYYFSEKLLDCFLMGCYPIYYGCKEITKYFPENSLSLIDIKDFDSSIDIIKRVLDDNLYNERQNELRLAKKLVLYDYNLFTVISKVVKNHSRYFYSNNKEKFILYPQKKSRIDVLKENIARKFGIILK